MSAHLKRAQLAARGERVGAREPAPLEREAVQPDAAVELDREQHHQVQRPHQVGPDAVGRLERADAVGAGQHDVEVHRGHEEQREARHHLPVPERGVLVLHARHVLAVGAVLAVARRELAQRERRVGDEQREDRRHQDRHQPGQRFAEEVVALEEAGHGPHRVPAEQDARHEEHVDPHEEPERQARSALQQVEPRGPARRLDSACSTRMAPRGVTSDGADFDWIASAPAAISVFRRPHASSLRSCPHIVAPTAIRRSSDEPIRRLPRLPARDPRVRGAHAVAEQGASGPKPVPDGPEARAVRVRRHARSSRTTSRAVPVKYYAIAVIFILFDLETVFLFLWALGCPAAHRRAARRPRRVHACCWC